MAATGTLKCRKHGKRRKCLLPAFSPFLCFLYVCRQFTIIAAEFKSLPNGKFFDWSKLKAFADDKFHCKIEICFGKGSRKHCVKRRKCWLPAFPPFPTMFSKGFFPRVVKSRHCVVKS